MCVLQFKMPAKKDARRKLNLRFTVEKQGFKTPLNLEELSHCILATCKITFKLNET